MQVGIVVPAWNVAAYPGDTAASALARTYANWRLVVVDDGSADGTSAVMEACSDPRINLIPHANAGVSPARNRGLAALGPADAVLFLDGDDHLVPDASARLVAALDEAPGAVAAAGVYALAGRVRRSVAGDVLERLLRRNICERGIGRTFQPDAPRQPAGGRRRSE